MNSTTFIFTNSKSLKIFRRNIKVSENLTILKTLGLCPLLPPSNDAPGYKHSRHVIIPLFSLRRWMYVLRTITSLIDQEGSGTKLKCVQSRQAPLKIFAKTICYGILIAAPLFINFEPRWDLPAWNQNFHRQMSS